ncbi:MAG: hypothetical protein F6K21_24370 [Symploca sp. SIO2D2]|nr:hypothetical protein [Symploca sp. SIO2D2]
MDQELELGELLEESGIEDAWVGIHRTDDDEILSFAVSVGKQGASWDGLRKRKKRWGKLLQGSASLVAWRSVVDMPLDENGDVLVEQLPLSRDDLTIIEPRDETEQWMCDLLKELFGRNRVGVDEDFFDLGLRSLLAVQIVSRIRGEYGLEIPFRAIYDNPTIEELAGYIKSLQWAVEVPALIEGDREISEI